MNKSLYLGQIKDYNNSNMTVHVRIEFRDKRLSISGVIGAKSNGDSRGSSGQCVDEIRRGEFTEYAPGWDAATVARFCDAWDTWHLNNMRAGCEHQRANWNTGAPLQVVHYGLTTEAHAMKRAAEKHVTDAAIAGAIVAPPLTVAEKFLLGSDWFRDFPSMDVLSLGLHEIRKTETKTANWVNPSEHPDGLLCKPCEVCGYKYGSAWLHEDVPADVIAFLDALPPASVACPWQSI